MDEHVRAKLGPPDLQLAGFQLWVHGYEFPQAMDAWDGNWLRVTVHCGASGASVWASGALLDTVSIARFSRGLTALHETLGGEAVLDSHEPNVSVRATVVDSSGHIEVRVELTPDHLAQMHRFEFAIDQSYVPAALEQCHALLKRYPVRDAAARGA